MHHFHLKYRQQGDRIGETVIQIRFLSLVVLVSKEKLHPTRGAAVHLHTRDLHSSLLQSASALSQTYHGMPIGFSVELWIWMSPGAFHCALKPGSWLNDSAGAQLRGPSEDSSPALNYPISIPTLSLVFSSPRICWISQISGDWLRPATARRMTVLTWPTWPL